ncbi:hypothetical protein [Pseudophaeobacter sp.]|uniref:hypothetical protein n=1 Tax=Pseudophaeobacter sp. TaxID=1971739 RepID=UPI003296FE59
MLQFLTDLFKPKPAVAPPITSRTSTSIKLRDLGPFLNRLADSPRFTLPRGFAEAILGALPDLELDQSRRWRVDGDFDGAATRIEIQILMEELDAPDLTFYGSAEVVAEIDTQLDGLDEILKG